jgi:hypothetical protein
MILTGETRSNGRQSVPVPLCAPQTPHALANNRNCASTIRCSRCATRATTQPGYIQINLRQWFPCDVWDVPFYCRNYSAGVHQPRLFVQDAIFANRTRQDKRLGNCRNGRHDIRATVSANFLVSETSPSESKAQGSLSRQPQLICPIFHFLITLWI